MKNVLLTTTALVAFAGAATADITWTGSASVGYNDEYVDGVYYDADIAVAGSAGFVGGYVGSFSYGIDITDGSLDGDDYPEISIGNGTYTASAGDTGAASDHFSGVTGMTNGLADTDGALVGRGDAIVNGFGYPLLTLSILPSMTTPTVILFLMTMFPSVLPVPSV